jgi:Zn-dependent protease
MTFLIVLAGWIFSLCLHEYAHARVAYEGGDTSVREKGYLSFNPLRYTDPMYSIFMPLLFLLMGGIGLPGGAVYIEHWRLRSKHWDSAVSLAGPASNVLLTLVLGAVLRLTPVAETAYGPAVAFLALLQVTAVILNLLPIPGLDGYGVIEPYLPEDTRRSMRQAGRWVPLAFFFALWYVPPISNAFWALVDTVAAGVGVPMPLAFDGLDAFMFWQRR